MIKRAARAATISARQENMSKDLIERAVKKASGGDSESYDELRDEGEGRGACRHRRGADRERNRAALDTVR